MVCQRVSLFRIRQIWYKPLHLGYLDEGFVPYKNSLVTSYFENRIIRELYYQQDYKDAEYYGVFSWKFKEKHLKTSASIKRAMENHKSDVYSFFGNKQFKGSSKANTFYDTHHPYLLEIGSKLIKTLFNEDISKIKADRIYYNHWIAKSSIFENYCKEMLLPVMDLMENDKDIKALCDKDSGYNDKAQRQHIRVNKPMDADTCTRLLGVPYYDHRAFVLERLPSIYFALKGHEIRHI